MSLMNPMVYAFFILFLVLKNQNVYAAEVFGQYKSVDEIPKLVVKITKTIKSVGTLGTSSDCLKPSPVPTKQASVTSKTTPAARPSPVPHSNINANLNLNINCNYPGVETATFGGKINLKIKSGSVTAFSAKANGCQLNFNEFRQVPRSDGAIIMKNSKGCSVLIYPAIRINNSQSNEYSFSVTNCKSTCGESINDLFWQAELNPTSNLCY